MHVLCRSIDPHSEITGYLDIHNNGITGAGTSYIAEALRTSRALRKLDLHGNPIGDKGLQHIAGALITNTTLIITELNLSACELRITEENGPALTECYKEIKLRENSIYHGMRPYQTSQNH